jgi:Smg protein
MKENDIDVLLYLFETYIDTEERNKPDNEVLELELEQVGFQELEIHKALEWLDNMTVAADQPLKRHATMRVFSDNELERLDVECRGYLLFLEQVGVLDVETREIVLERVMALDTEEIDLDQLKWVVLMVLFYQPGREVAFAWMEDLVFEDMEAIVH